MKNSAHGFVLSFGLAVAAVALSCGGEPPKTSGNAAPAPAAGHGTQVSYQALLDLINEPDEFTRARKLGELLPTLGPESLPDVKNFLEQTHLSGIELSASDYELLMRYWARHDPEAASTYAFGKSPRAYRVAAIHATLRPWAKENPRQALDKARVWGRDRGDFGVATQVALVRGWYESGQPGLEQYIHDLGAGFERQRAITAHSTALIRARGGEALADWAEAVPDEDAAYKLEVYRNAGAILAAFDVDVAKRFCDAHCDGQFGASLRNRIATRFAEVGRGEAALEWLATAPEGEEKNFAVRRTFAVWGDLDSAAAVAWMKPKLAGEPPAWLRPALPVYVVQLGKESPAEALAAAARFFEGRQLEESTTEIARHWRQQDEAAAEAWLAQSSLSPQALEIVRAPQTNHEKLLLEHEQRQRLLRAAGS